MADKTFRPITDVEIVEQMTENDTVLIEQNGMIKRTKGVVGGSGGEKRTIIVDMPSPGYLTFTIDISFDDLRAAIKAGNVPDIECLTKSNSSDDCTRVDRVVGVSIEDKDNIIIDIKSFSVKYSSDGTLQPVME